MRRANSLKNTLMLGKSKGKRRRGWQDEMVGWYYWLNGHEFEQIPEDSGRQRSLMCCSPWGCKELDMTQWLNKNKSIRFCSRVLVTLDQMWRLLQKQSARILDISSQEMNWKLEILSAFQILLLSCFAPKKFFFILLKLQIHKGISIIKVNFQE